MAREFNGTSDYLSIADCCALDFPDSGWAMGGWFWHTGGASTTHMLYSHGVYNTTPSCLIYCYNDSVSAVVVSDDGCNKLLLGVLQSLAANTWHHVLLNNVGDDLRSIINGTQKGHNPTSTNWGTIAVSGAALLGKHVGSADYLCGGMAEWAKWDFSLSDEQIASLVHGVRPVDIGTQPAWYLPLIAGLEDEMGPLDITTIGTTVGEHPAKIIPAGLVA